MENKEKSQNIINNVDKENTIIPSQFKRVEILLADGLYDKADEVLERFLDTDPTNSKAYLYKLLVELKLSSINQLKKYDKPIDTYYNYKKTYEYGNLEEQEILNSINESIKTNIANKRLSTIYDNAIRLKNEKKYDLAIDLFNVISEYKDSLNQTKECQCLKQQSIYSSAKKMMESKKYAKAIEMFNKISDYDDASIQIDKCIELIAIEKKESIYKKCVFNRELTIKDYSIVLEAYNNLKTISDYKDAKELLTKYKELLEEFDVQKKNRKKKIAKISAIASDSIVGVSAITLLMIFVIVPFARYSIAQNLLDSNPQKAIKYFEKSEWKDYSKQIELAKARIYFNNAAFSDGIKQICDNGGSVTINYNTNGGSEIESQEVTHFSDYIVEETTKDSDTFYKWSIDSISYKKNNYDVELTLKANWLNDYCEFGYNLDGTLSLQKFKINDLSFSTFNIPEEVNGTKVTTIKSSAFSDIHNLKRIVIPETIETIEANAFNGHNLLTIYAAPTDKPSGWSDDWNSNLNVVWNVSKINNSGNFEYWIRGTKSNKYAAISKYNGLEKTVDLPDTIDDLPVQGVADFAFLDNTNITEIIIPSGVTSIGKSAFSGCSALSSIEMSDNILNIDERAFYNCSTLNKILLPKALLAISDYSFYGCSSLKYIKIPDQVTSIGECAFAECKNLETVIIPDNVTTIKRHAFYYSNYLTIYAAFNERPDGWAYQWKSINSAVCWNVLDVKSNDLYKYLIKGPKSNKNIKIIEYLGRQKTEVEIPDEIDGIPVKEIGNNVFLTNNKLTKVVIPDGVEVIREHAFHGCYNLTVVMIPDTVEVIESNAFYLCSNITFYCASNEKPEGWSGNWCSYDTKTENIIWNVRGLGKSSQYDYWVRGTADDQYISLVKYNGYESTVNIPSKIDFWDVKEIGEKCFYEDTSIRKVLNLDNIVSIGDEAFYGCENLTEIFISDSVINMGSKVLDYCNYDLIIYCAYEKIPNTWPYDWATDSSFSTLIFNVRKIDWLGDYQCWIRGSKDNPYISIRNVSVSGFGDNITIPDEINGIEVKEIGSTAFYNDRSIKHLYIPNSVTSIESKAFYGCDNLLSVEMSENITSIPEKTFYDCKKLETIMIPNNVTSIGSEAFSSCSSLKQIKIPLGVTRIGYGAFYGCDNLSIYCESSEKPSGWNDSFSGAKRIIWDVNEIGTDGTFDYAKLGSGVNNRIVIMNYLGNESIVEVPAYINNYPVTAIGPYAFENSSVQKITLPTTISKIYYKAFYNAKMLNDINLPMSLQKIEWSAFSYCDSLKSIEIPTSVTQIDDYAFENLDDIVIYYKNETGNDGWNTRWAGGNYVEFNVSKHAIFESFEYAVIGNSEDNYIKVIRYIGQDSNPQIPANINGISVKAIRKNAFKNNTYIESIVIPDGILSIGEYAFSNCTSLKSITIPDSVTSIGEYAFESCTSLESIVLPKSLTTIESYLFLRCTSLKSVTIGENVTAIKTGAFQSCESIATIKLPSSVTTLYDGVFNGCTALNKIFIPKTITTIYGSPFKNCTINVYCEALLKPTDWSNNWNKFGTIQYVFGATEDQM